MKRLFATMLTLALMTACFAGCGAKEDADSKTKNESSTSQSVTKTEETSEEKHEETTEEENGGLEQTHYRDDGSNDEGNIRIALADERECRVIPYNRKTEPVRLFNECEVNILYYKRYYVGNDDTH